MKTMRLKVGKNVLDISDLIVIALIIAVPYINLFYFNVYKTKIRFITIALVIIAVLYVLHVIKINRFHMIYTLLLVYLGCSMLVLNFPNSFEHFVLILFGITVSNIKFEEKTLYFLIYVMMLLGLFFAITLLWHWLSPESFYPVLKPFVSETQYLQAHDYVVGGDYTGFACESHYACLLISPAASVIFSKYFYIGRKKHDHLLFTTFIFLVLILALFVSGRRAYVLFFPAVIYILTIYILLNRRSKYAKLGATFLIILGGILLYFVFFSMIVNLLTGGTGKGIQLSKRQVYWELALNMFHQKPLTGMGMRSYDIFYDKMSKRGLTFAGAHNCYLQMLAEIGIIGTVIFCLSIIYMFIRTLKVTIESMRNNDYVISRISMTSLLMQGLMICIAASESVFFAPNTTVLYFIILNLSGNAFRLFDEKKRQLGKLNG